MATDNLHPPGAADKAGARFWESLWEETQMPAAIDPRSRELGAIFNRRLHEWFTSAIGDGAAGRSLIEVGCGRSAWLPYFHTEFGLRVAGIDYSELGCRQAQAILDKSQISGEIVCADLFSPPEDLLGRFDLAVSAGVVEHFADTSACLSACAALLAPGGTLITVVPNLTGTLGMIQRAMDREIYDIHVPLTAPAVGRAHRAAGLDVVDCRYLLSVGYGVLRPGPPGSPRFRAKRRLARGLEAASVAVWWLEDRTRRLPAGRLFSPYVVCAARRPAPA